jgi:hypothetical protein
MTVLLVSTIRRHAPLEEPSGYLYALDVEKEQVLRRCPIIEPPFREYNSNPRGGTRGSRGIAFWPEQVAITNFSMVFRFSRRWELQGLMTHRSCSGIHDIYPQEDGLWVTSTSNDLLMYFNLAGELVEHYYLRKPAAALKKLGWKPPLLFSAEDVRSGKREFRNPGTFDLVTYDGAHVNSVCKLSNGDLLVSLGLVVGAQYSNLLRVKHFLVQRGLWTHFLEINRRVSSLLHLKSKMNTSLVAQPARGKSAVVRIGRDHKGNGSPIAASISGAASTSGAASSSGAVNVGLVLPEMTAPSHSLLLLPDESGIYLNTSQGEVVHFEPFTGKPLSVTKVTDGFLRGVAHLPDHRLVMGSKNELIRFDLSECRVAQRMHYSQDVNEAVFAVQVLPEGFDLPPEDLHKRIEASAAHQQALAGF